MDHAEYMYLLFRAREIQKMAQRAAEEREEFIPADSFSPLQCGLEAQAVLCPLQPQGADALVLRLRHPDDGVDRTALVRQTQHIFFPGTYTVVPSILRENGRCEYLAYADPAPELPRFESPHTP